jgi:hypothetical protein
MRARTLMYFESYHISVEVALEGRRGSVRGAIAGIVRTAARIVTTTCHKSEGPSEIDTVHIVLL